LNFLAHIYLSGNNEEKIVGNYIADSIKGKNFLNYPIGIQKGILLHRAIDDFTDHHPIVKECLVLLRPKLGKYSGVALDICFDHFLARGWNSFHAEDFRVYTLKVMVIIGNHYHLLPVHSKLFFDYAKQTDRLFRYKDIDGIEEVFKGMHRRIKVENSMHLAHEAFVKNYQQLQLYFSDYFPQLVRFVSEYEG
jgi:acyl carrier protein phosphodiesterase